jgi:hypothetical protein
MGFSVSQAKKALTATENGQDVQAALGTLLGGNGGSNFNERSSTPSIRAAQTRATPPPLIMLDHYGNDGLVMSINTGSRSSFEAREMYGRGICIRYNLFILLIFRSFMPINLSIYKKPLTAHFVCIAAENGW